MAIEQGIIVLSWYENLEKSEVPPEYLWEDSEGLDQWFARVEEKRSDGQSGETQARIDVPNGDQDQHPGMAENDYARALKQG